MLQKKKYTEAGEMHASHETRRTLVANSVVRVFPEPRTTHVFCPLCYLSTTKLQTTVYNNTFSEVLRVAILGLASEIAAHIPKEQNTVLRIYWIIHRYHTVPMRSCF